MPESYSKTEVDLKLEKLLIELKSEIRESRNAVEAKLGSLESSVEAKLGSLESSVEAKLGSLESSVEVKLGSLEAKMGSFETKFTFLQWLTGGTFFLLLGIVITAALKMLITH